MTPKERPILFSGEMVKAILDGRKTQTRRVVDWNRIVKQTGCTKGKLIWSTSFDSWAVVNGNGEADMALVECPYGVPGNRLWVRETWHGPATEQQMRNPVHPLQEISYAADFQGLNPGWKWKPSIHMPRWASRITLEITEVRVQRVQEISEEDAKAEGVAASTAVEMKDGSPCYSTPFQILWNQINGVDAWEANPWVWAITFKRLEAK